MESRLLTGRSWVLAGLQGLERCAHALAKPWRANPASVPTGPVPVYSKNAGPTGNGGPTIRKKWFALSMETEGHGDRGGVAKDAVGMARETPERPQRDPKETPQRVQRRPLIPDRDRLPLGHAQSAPA